MLFQYNMIRRGLTALLILGVRQCESQRPGMSRGRDSHVFFSILPYNLLLIIRLFRGVLQGITKKTKTMKKFFMIACAVCLAMNLSAQTMNLGTNNATPSVQTEEDAQPKGGASVEYHEYDGGFGGGINFIFDHIVLDFNIRNGEVAGYDNELWCVGAGGNYRHWISKSFFIEGQGGLAYYHRETTFKEKTVASINKLGLYATPRAGLKIGKTWGITVGYRFDFIDFKFDNISDRGHFTVGFSWIM